MKARNKNRTLAVAKTHKFTVNTDTADIAARSIGIYCHSSSPDRYLHGQVRHDRTKAGVSEATTVARLFSAAPELFLAMKEFFDAWPQFDPGSEEWDREVSGADLVDWLSTVAPTWLDAIKKAEGRI